MPLWGSNDQANNAPKWGAELVHTSPSAVESLYGNTTTGAFIQNEINSLVFISSADIANGSVPQHSGGPGWYLLKQGSSGRAGRVTYEALVVFSPLNGLPSNELTFNGIPLTLNDQPLILKG